MGTIPPRLPRGRTTDSTKAAAGPRTREITSTAFSPEEYPRSTVAGRRRRASTRRVATTAANLPVRTTPGPSRRPAPAPSPTAPPSYPAPSSAGRPNPSAPSPRSSRGVPSRRRPFPNPITSARGARSSRGGCGRVSLGLSRSPYPIDASCVPRRMPSRRGARRWRCSSSWSAAPSSSWACSVSYLFCCARRIPYSAFRMYGFRPARVGWSYTGSYTTSRISFIVIRGESRASWITSGRTPRRSFRVPRPSRCRRSASTWKKYRRTIWTCTLRTITSRTRAARAFPIWISCWASRATPSRPVAMARPSFWGITNGEC
mmetsp:Transcript_5767/g.11162  ORF Transcript_5767/g.11162 Transcript_5767/m.11162 type:complete len:317 (+) Transcript_5767:89-1039(+)